LAFLSASTNLSGCPILAADARQNSSGQPYCSVDLSFFSPSGHLLALKISDGEHALRLGDPDLVGITEIARWDSHFMPDLLRFEEFESLARALAERAQPLWAVQLLLAPYVPVTAQYADAYRAMLRECLTATGAFTEAEVDYVVARVRVRAELRWVRDASLGWQPEGQNVHSLRSASSKVDFAAFRALLAAVGHA
jgi:hypothetical protein